MAGRRAEEAGAARGMAEVAGIGDVTGLSAAVASQDGQDKPMAGGRLATASVLGAAGTGKVAA